MQRVVSLRSLVVAVLLLGSTFACRTVYYDVWEVFGREKRHILTKRVEASQEDQRAAQEQFQTTFELFQQVTQFDGGDLERLYRRLEGAYADSEEKAQAVRDRIRSIEEVAGDLFTEWEREIEEIQNPGLRGRSQASLRETRARYGDLIAAMQRAETRMDPVLVAFRDQVLFLKHNLNARAIASLRGDLESIEDDVAALIAEMQNAIQEAEAFVATL